MRFGAFVPQGWRVDLAGIPVESHWHTMVGVARTIEQVGFESLWVYDHFHTTPEPTREATYEAWTLMAALATTTSTVRLGQMCTCNGYRSPAYLAKVAASIDVISGGRVEMGIGAGWYEHEYHGYGYPFPKPSVRLGELGEAVEIMRMLWTEDDVVYDGKHYQLDGAICRPHPVQDPHIPLWIAGGGEQLTLRIAARYADYTNFGGGNLEVFNRKSEILRHHCTEVGRDPAAIVRSANFNVICAPTEAEVDSKRQWLRDHRRSYLTEANVERQLALYDAMSGTPEQLAERLSTWSSAGLDYAICYFPDAAFDTSSLELFASEVIPQLS